MLLIVADDDGDYDDDVWMYIFFPVFELMRLRSDSSVAMLWFKKNGSIGKLEQLSRCRIGLQNGDQQSVLVSECLGGIFSVMIKKYPFFGPF